MDDGEERKAVLIANERAKIVAGFFNTLASGSILAGLVIPAASFVIGTLPPNVMLASWRFGAAALIWCSVGGALHYFARRAIRRLEP